MLTLGIDTSNYATSLAVFDTDAGEVVCDCKKFLPVKEGQLGLRQSDALFHHTAALPAMLAELGARADLTQVRAVGVSARPRPVEGSYMPCFLAGVSAATAFSLSRALPLIELTHQQGHIAAALYAAGISRCLSGSHLYFMSPAAPPTFFCAMGPSASRRWAQAAICTPDRLWTASASSWAFRSRRASMSASRPLCVKKKSIPRSVYTG